MAEAAPPATAPRGGRGGSVSTAAAATAADEGVPTPSAEAEIPAVPGSEPEQQTSQPEPEPEKQVALTGVLADEDAPSTPRLSENTEPSSLGAVIVTGHEAKGYNGVYSKVGEHAGWPRFERAFEDDVVFHLFYHAGHRAWFFRTAFTPDDDARKSWAYFS